MQPTRLLLPFTEQLDIEALAFAVRYASSYQATLVPLALIPLTKRQWVQGPRLEAIEQASDFLEALTSQAQDAGVSVEPYTSETRDTMHTIGNCAQELHCEEVLLFQRGKTTPLVAPALVTALLAQQACTLRLVRLAPTLRARIAPALRSWRAHTLRSRETVFSHVRRMPV